MRVRVDRDLCIGAASCIALLPEVFELDEEGKAIIKSLKGTKTSDWTDGKELSKDLQMILEAARSCPTNAIFIEDDEGKQIYP
ncbi:MAG: Ferredoxin [Parcubacteria group bacterium GW2011_GWD2_43_10]|uniref:Ferredoxin n=4 Tax=Candidatus Vebleniibacteriota TaxID=1817921 RepID=A0A1G2Q718_9BACT|nr:MAG: Ferredoxin [Parcubacteria group bacterium GW2011_GWA2_42_80]KKS79890.1 MAG: Ferredoxin [Parcubacteria group bacterium GW2011_GWD1_42_9]KKS83811.1 MAG: Ferredoxin [Parcubacteria group bacterium GW2011_GWD2_43_10]KKS93647.1 MAG: Ferredoxin [Parcubacteria group bacterium GW2011_GWE2_43_12]KKT14109.1 MAG: Ferredoxin [Parcubacteria group bacterium GW2011_GWA1_43_27]KKT16535.1 MAG: Ferredoxin [Parcubacteria group bacterium GW2011_GWB1_43_66]KKT22757.1 MAG: Ferredoxin [Parcubacteria group ba